MLDGSLFISIFCFIKNFYKIFCTFLPVKKYYTTLICLKQAIQPRVVGPLFIKGCIVYIVTKLIGIRCGTSINIINVREPWRVSAMARKVMPNLLEHVF